MTKLSWKQRQAIGLKRASLRRNISAQQSERMRNRAERLLREDARDKERNARIKQRNQ